MEELFRVFSMIKTIEDYHRGDISEQMPSAFTKGLGGFKTVDNADCSPLQPVESVKQKLRSSIAKMTTVLQARVNLSPVKKAQVFGRKESLHLV